MKPKPYPDLVCSDCAEGAGGKLASRAADWRLRRCDVCRKHVLVTSPSDYGWPRFPGHEVRVTICPAMWAIGSIFDRVTARARGRKGADTGSG